MEKWPTREEAQKILDEWVSNKNLKKHAYAVEAAMRAYAEKYGGDPEKWGIVGLLHDFDYEKYPDLRDHPFQGVAYLTEHGYAEELIEGILAHADHAAAEKDTDMKKAIYAVDELTGLIVAVALTRPSKKIADVTVESVVKKMREKAFAAGVNRDIVMAGAGELGLLIEEHIEIVLKAMQGIADKLEL
jgi:putative nucleotidyltransferase with HDIG domain